MSHPEIPALLKEETGLLHARGYRVLSSPCPLLPGVLEVDFKPVVPVPKSRDSSGKSVRSIERMPSSAGWLVDLWGCVNPECWDGHESRIFIVKGW